MQVPLATPLGKNPRDISLVVGGLSGNPQSAYISEPTAFSFSVGLTGTPLGSATDLPGYFSFVAVKTSVDQDALRYAHRGVKPWSYAFLPRGFITKYRTGGAIIDPHDLLMSRGWVGGSFNADGSAPDQVSRLPSQHTTLWK